VLKNEELQKNNAEKDKFFSIVAHDLRCPLSGFLGLTDIMASGLSSMTMAEGSKDRQPNERFFGQCVSFTWKSFGMVAHAAGTVSVCS